MLACFLDTIYLFLRVFTLLYLHTTKCDRTSDWPFRFGSVRFGLGKGAARKEERRGEDRRVEYPRKRIIMGVKVVHTTYVRI